MPFAYFICAFTVHCRFVLFISELMCMMLTRSSGLMLKAFMGLTLLSWYAC